MASDKPFLSFVVEQELLERLDDFRFKQRFESRAAAIKWLLDYALNQKPVPERD
jgi:metal-responsive CopG/Arc/MetJ family transcriptional regulator